MHFGYRGCFEDYQKNYAEDHKCTVSVMATRVGFCGRLGTNKLA